MSEHNWQINERLNGKYKFIDTDLYNIWWLGCVFKMHHKSYDYDVARIVTSILSGTSSFSDLHGSYRIVVYSKQSNEYFFWCDNSGSQVLFVDYKMNRFGDSLIKLSDMRQGDIQPSYLGIAQLFSNNLLNNMTIIEGIERTSSEKYYCFRNGEISVLDKSLPSFRCSKGHSLTSIMNGFVGAVDRENISAVCTGGTDSRTILAHLNRCRQSPLLTLSGHDDNPDIPIAYELSQKLGTKLFVYDPKNKEENWLEEACKYSDGIYDPVLAYRHMRLGKWLNENECNYQFGGVGGEFYKNAFCCWARWGLIFRPITPKVVYNDLIRTDTPIWAGQQLKEAYKKLPNELLPIINEKFESGVLRSHNKAGYILLQQRYSSITNNYTPDCIKCDPLMDRDVVASVSNKSALLLSMHIWQRIEIFKSCREICDIPTDQGYSCSLNPLKLSAESVKKLLFYSGRVIARIEKMLGKSYKDKNPKYWDDDYADALNNKTFSNAVSFCKNNGIIDEDINCNDIPLNAVGNIILVAFVLNRGRV